MLTRNYFKVQGLLAEAFLWSWSLLLTENLSQIDLSPYITIVISVTNNEQIPQLFLQPWNISNFRNSKKPIYDFMDL